MIHHKLQHVFFGDSDVAVFANMTEAWLRRKDCSAAINIESQGQNYHWVGAGESSLWTQAAIADFCQFTSAVYRDKAQQVLHPKLNNHGSSVVDMSLLWLWWVAHKRASQVEVGWGTGRPYASPDPRELARVRDQSDEAFRFAAALPLPEVDASLALCNGLDVFSRTVFDHMHGWQGCEGFTLDVGAGGEGRPHCVGASLNEGGKPESVSGAEAEALSLQRLDVLTLHYQGDRKGLLPYDVCRVLLLTGDGAIARLEVATLCADAMRERGVTIDKYPSGKLPAGEYPCSNHEAYRPQVEGLFITMCF